MTLTHKLTLALLALPVCMLLSLMTGPLWIAPDVALRALLHPNPLDATDIIVRTARLSRTVMAVCVGACLAVAGALMQALTRNPMASPGLFGVNAGATFFIVAFGAMLSLSHAWSTLTLAFCGATVAGVLVWAASQASHGRLNPLRLVLAGVAISALFTAFSQAILVMNQESLDTVLFWLAGSLTGNDLSTLMPALLASLAFLVPGLLIARQINVLNAGDEIARGLGQNIARTRLFASVLVVGLAGCAVAIAGNIGFVGLIVPHIARRLFGADHRVLLPACALLGAILLLLADIAARVILLPQELPVGVMTALIGAPFFILLARRGGSGE